jgi:hypothetical protein
MEGTVYVLFSKSYQGDWSENPHQFDSSHAKGVVLTEEEAEEWKANPASNFEVRGYRAVPVGAPGD